MSERFAKTMAEQFDSLRDCTVCYERMENAKILPCHHSLCGKCVEKLKQRNTIKCPMDNQVFNFSDVKHDFRFEHIKERLKSARKRKDPQQGALVLCSTCEENDAVFICDTCSEYMCKRCKKAHNKILASHVTVSLEEKQKFHREEALKQHKQIEQKIDRFQNRVSEIDKAIHEQWQHVSDVSKEIDDYVAKVTEVAEKKKEEMIQKVKNLKCQEKLNTCFEDIAVARAEAASLKDYIDTNPTQAIQNIK